jgi:hypothetical protein
MIAIVSAMVAASVASIFTAMELDKMRAKQKADMVAKLGLMATSEISNLQEELIRLTAEVIRSLDAAWGSMDTIDHVLLVCDVADKQVHVMKSAMQAAMGGHVSVAAFTQLDYGRVALRRESDRMSNSSKPESDRMDSDRMESDKMDSDRMESDRMSTNVRRK